MLMAPEITLQVNMSAGDVAYADVTVPALVRAHGAGASHRLAVVDCCRPQRTKLVDPDRRFPESGFRQRVERIRAIAESLKAAGYLDEIVYLEAGDPLLAELSRIYLRGLITETHDYAGCALMAYLAGFELPRTRFVLHYDADMLLHQTAGYDWSLEAAETMIGSSGAVAATPRTSPPFTHLTDAPDGPSLHEGLPYSPVSGGWRNAWFSTRCMLLDGERFAAFLPLMRGRTLLEVLAVKYLRRGYPRSPEVMLSRRLGSSGCWRLNLDTPDAWLLHPTTKPPEYLEILPRIQHHVLAGEYPVEQAGRTEIDVPAWERFVRGTPAGQGEERCDDGVSRRSSARLPV